MKSYIFLKILNLKTEYIKDRSINIKIIKLKKVVALGREIIRSFDLNLPFESLILFKI